jgi:hypothetical protein
LRARGKDEIDRIPDEFCRKIREPTSLLICPSIVDGKVPSFDPSEVMQTLLEGLAVQGRPRIRREIADAKDALPLLRLGGERQGEYDYKCENGVSHGHLPLTPGGNHLNHRLCGERLGAERPALPWIESAHGLVPARSSGMLDAVGEAHAVSKLASTTERWRSDELLHKYAAIMLDDPLGSHVAHSSSDLDVTQAFGLRLAQYLI